MTYVITGIRGSGKTVLLSSIASFFKQKKDWIVVDPGMKENIIENIVSQLYEVGTAKKIFIKKEFNVKIKDKFKNLKCIP